MMKVMTANAPIRSVSIKDFPISTWTSFLFGVGIDSARHYKQIGSL